MKKIELGDTVKIVKITGPEADADEEMQMVIGAVGTIVKQTLVDNDTILYEVSSANPLVDLFAFTADELEVIT